MFCVYLVEKNPFVKGCDYESTDDPIILPSSAFASPESKTHVVGDDASPVRPILSTLPQMNRVISAILFPLYIKIYSKNWNNICQYQ